MFFGTLVLAAVSRHISSISTLGLPCCEEAHTTGRGLLLATRSAVLMGRSCCMASAQEPDTLEENLPDDPNSQGVCVTLSHSLPSWGLTPGRRDKPSPLCPVWIPDIQNMDPKNKWWLFYATEFWSDLLMQQGVTRIGFGWVKHESS